MGSDRYMEQQMAREIMRLKAENERLGSMLRKQLDAMPGTNVDLKDEVRKKLGRQWRNNQFCRVHSQRNCVMCPVEPAGESLPFAKGSDTSEEAAESMVPLAAEIRERVFRYIQDCGPWGSTCDMAEQALGLSHQTCSARFNELRNRKRIEDSGATRMTRSGRKAVVYVLPRARA